MFCWRNPMAWVSFYSLGAFLQGGNSMPAVERDVDPCLPTAPGPAALASLPAFEQEVCQRLPLADAVYRLLDFVTADPLLDEVFARHRGASYQDVITFPLFVHLIAG